MGAGRQARDWSSWGAAWRRRSEGPGDEQGSGRQQGGGGQRRQGPRPFLSSRQWNLPPKAGWSVVFRLPQKSRAIRPPSASGFPLFLCPLRTGDRPCWTEGQSSRGRPAARTSLRRVPASGTTFSPSHQALGTVPNPSRRDPVCSTGLVPRFADGAAAAPGGPGLSPALRA